MAQLQQQLTETQNRNHYLAARAAELDVELEHAGTELQAAKLAGANSEDSSQLARENELLRNIVVRERQEEARRDEAWKLVLVELDRLKVRSDLLNKQIEFLAQPVTKLTAEELALFRQPVVSISNEKAGAIKMNFVFEKKSTADVGKSNAISTAVPNALPNELQEVVVAARKNVEQGKYRTAEKQYQTVLAKDPDEPRRVIQSWRGLLSHRQDPIRGINAEESLWPLRRMTILCSPRSALFIIASRGSTKR